jgi:exopolysaccharide production protein ExoZ
LLDQGPAANRELFGIQMLRGIAALLVVFHHTLEESRASSGAHSPDWLTTAGAAGVDIFFVISGFIMLYVSFPPGRGPLGSGSFLRRRIMRIYPLYWVCCAGVLALWAVGLFASKPISIPIIVKSIFLLPTPDSLVGVSWTLSYEIYFYIVFAAALALRGRVATVVATISTIVAMQVVASCFLAGEIGQFLANPISLEFCFGLMLALFWRRRLQKPAAIGLSVLCLVVIATAPLYIVHSSTNGLPDVARTIVWGVPAVFLVGAALSVGPPTSVVSRFAVLLGDASYAIYLTHVFVMVSYAKLLKATWLGTQSQFEFIPVVVAACIGVGLTTHFVLERPLLEFFRGFRREKKLGSTPSSAQVS